MLIPNKKGEENVDGLADNPEEKTNEERKSL
jgi:hypothetical protein